MSDTLTLCANNSSHFWPTNDSAANPSERGSFCSSGDTEIQLNPRLQRQIRLQEVGPAGQQRLSSSKVTVARRAFERSDVEHWVLRQYLERAGVAVEEASTGPDRVCDQALADDAGSFGQGFECESARDIAAGSRRALAIIRSILGVT
jgi:hypothetical protein